MESMSRGPTSVFGWLMACCVSDESGPARGDLFSAAVLFASGMAASGLTLYLGGLLHLV